MACSSAALASLPSVASNFGSILAASSRRATDVLALSTLSRALAKYIKYSSNCVVDRVAGAALRMDVHADAPGVLHHGHREAGSDVSCHLLLTSNNECQVLFMRTRN